jgi:hypothetical protein
MASKPEVTPQKEEVPEKEGSETLPDSPVCTENSDTDVAVMQSTEEGM